MYSRGNYLEQEGTFITDLQFLSQLEYLVDSSAVSAGGD